MMNSSWITPCGFETWPECIPDVVFKGDDQCVEVESSANTIWHWKTTRTASCYIQTECTLTLAWVSIDNHEFGEG